MARPRGASVGLDARRAGLSRGPGCLRRGRGCDISSFVVGASSAEVVELLGRVPVFSTLEPEDLLRIAQLAVPRSFAPGQVVFREGDSQRHLLHRARGHARAVREHGDGRTITLATFGPGDIFGELALFEDERRSATVEALQEPSVVAVLGPDMRRLMVEHPQIATRLVIALGRRLRESNERLARQSFQTVQRRVAAVLGELVAQAVAEGAAARCEVPVIATQADLAQLAGSSRESASRFLAVLERAGVISQGRGRWSCTTPRRCRRMSSESRPAIPRARPDIRAIARAIAARARERSAGGSVVREGRGGRDRPTRRAADGSRVLGLPKGHIDPGETAQQAAMREVREETGVTAELVEETRRGALLVSPRRPRGAEVGRLLPVPLPLRRYRRSRRRGRGGALDGPARGAERPQLRGRARGRAARARGAGSVAGALARAVSPGESRDR